jgi:hypothetical protein
MICQWQYHQLHICKIRQQIASKTKNGHLFILVLFTHILMTFWMFKNVAYTVERTCLKKILVFNESRKYWHQLEDKILYNENCLVTSLLVPATQ